MWTTIDSLYLALIATLLLLDYFLLWPAFVRRSRTAQDGARLWLWSRWMIMLWTLAGAGIALWWFETRPWAALRLTVPHGWRLWAAIGLVLMIGLFQGRAVLRIAGSTRRRIKFANPNVENIVPHTQSELGWWVATSVSAGFCEEFIFRGYLIWVFQPFAGLWGAAAISLIVFALAHVYQGSNGVVATAIVGGVLTLVVLILGSLWPAIALHALLDIAQGLIGWLALRNASGARDVVVGN